jgi:predicted TIM-barrel fold metal-dependent hydrolase
MSKIDRRSFLVSAGMTPVLAGWKSAPRAERIYDVPAAIHRYRKLDSHNHIFGDPGLAIASADRLEIEKLAISVPIIKPAEATPEAFRASNDRVLKAMRDFPGRFLGQCFINPHYGRESLEEIDRCLDAGMIGLGELYTSVRINDPQYFPIIEKCIELKAPLMCHCGDNRRDYRNPNLTGAPTCEELVRDNRRDFRDPDLPGVSRPEDFVEAGKRYPEAMLISGHIGGGGDWEYYCKTLGSAPTVFADTSGSVTDEGMVDFAVKCLGVRRLLFATDQNYETGVGKILAAKLTEEERHQIFFDNFNEILRKRSNHAH